jgi:hypothetical protein
MNHRLSRRLKTAVAAVAIAAQLGIVAEPALAFCGFYVVKADSKLFNKSSKVVLAWDQGKTAITMASDYQGDPKEFAVVIPVPTFIERKQIDVVDMRMVDHLDAFTAPRLVEYFDPDPCAQVMYDRLMMSASRAEAPRPEPPRAKNAGVTVEATYDVAEYDVSILSAEQSDGLVAWLTDNGYRIPAGAEDVLQSYIKQKMHFFVAKVNLDRMALLGSGYLRPLQVRYESKKFMLPLRLGTVNASGPQDLIVLALTRNGRVETSNYPTVKLPTGMDVPLYVKDEFGKFYTAMFDRAVAREDMRAVFLEYAWDMGWCDPCAAAPLSPTELVTLGARWTNGGGGGAFVTRLHVRYDGAHFPEDLMLLETRDRENFQGRYVLRHPWQGDSECRAASDYRASLPRRFSHEAVALADLTGWDVKTIRTRMATSGQSAASTTPDIGWWLLDRVFGADAQP